MPTPPPPNSIDAIDATSLAARLRLAAVEHLVETDSTMDRARERAESDAPLPAVVVADRQTRGRGRRGASWWQAEGSLAASVAYDSADLGGTEPLSRWSLACGIAVAEAVRAIEPSIDARVRWPNDVEAGSRKLAGILVETARGGRVIFGIGVNTTGSAADAPEAVRHRVATIPDLVGRPIRRDAILVEIIERLVPLCREIAARPESLVARYSTLCGLSGRPIRLHVGSDGAGRNIVDGICRGIAADGSILIERHSAIESFASGTLTPPGTEWRG
jgi:BirA family biotin operon repressor/biotin-[acetyl-CoA-carboxylase] ligase